jgi:hypothetical protein
VVVALVRSAESWVKDSRDLMVAFAPVLDGLKRLGVDPSSEWFASVADAAPRALAEDVGAVGARRDVTPASVVFVIEETLDGPTYA